MEDLIINTLLFALIGLFVVFFVFCEIVAWLNRRDKNNIMDFKRDVTEVKKSRKNKSQEREIKGDTTFIGINQADKTPVNVPNNAKHIFICGTTGSGKTVALSNFIESGFNNNYPMLIVDGKGDMGEGSLIYMIRDLKKDRKVYVVSMNNPDISSKYNPFRNTPPTVVKDMLMSMTEWSEDYYKANVDRYLQRLISMLDKMGIKISFKSIVENMPVNKFLDLSSELEQAKIITKEDNIDNIDLVKETEKAITGSYARFSTIFESDLGNIFDETGIDILTAIKENASILFVLNPLTYPEVSSLIGNLIIIDSKKAVAGLYNSKPKRAFFLFDEINVYASKEFLNLVNKSRSANVTSILATQSLSDLDEAAGVHFKEQIIENCNNYIILRQNSDVNAEKFASIIGTRVGMDITYQIKSDYNTTSDTGLGSMRSTREYIYHPDDIKSLKTGEAIFVSKDDGYNTRVNINKPL